jgi:hypothetical protein
MKKCNKCKETKSLSDFHKCKSNNDGLSYQCKECQREENRQSRINPNSARNRLGAGVYAIVRKSDCKIMYVGQTKRLAQRKFEHFNNGVNPACSWILFNGLNPNDFEFAILCKEDNELKRKQLENHYIETLGLPQKLNVL